MNWLTYGVPAAAVVFGLFSLGGAWLMSARFHRRHPKYDPTIGGKAVGR